MSVNYDLYETSNPDKEGEVLPLHARVLLKGSYTAEEFADQVVAFQHNASCASGGYHRSYLERITAFCF